jgi:hypothetical protein
MKSERGCNNAAACFASYAVDALDIQREQFGQRHLNLREQESVNEPSAFQYIELLIQTRLGGQALAVGEQLHVLHPNPRRWKQLLHFFHGTRSVVAMRIQEMFALVIVPYCM